MAHFAEIDENNIVVRVLVVDNSQEYRGQEFLSKDLGFQGTWIQTSYNSKGGKRYNPETGEYIDDNHLRYNFAQPGYYYNKQEDAFIPPRPESFPSWILNENTFLWETPIPMPENDGLWAWDEENLTWQQVIIPEAQQ